MFLQCFTNFSLFGEEVEDGLAGVGVVRVGELVGVAGQAVHIVVQLAVAWNALFTVSTWVVSLPGLAGYKLTALCRAEHDTLEELWLHE